MRKKDIKQVLLSLGSKTFKDSGQSIQSDCPLAPFTHEGGKDSRPSFGAKEESGLSYCHCFSCGYSGSLMSLVREYGKYAIPEGIFTHEEMKELVDFIFLAEDEEVEYVPEIIETPKPSSQILDSIGVWHDYFQDRGIDKEVFKEWNLGYFKPDNRIMFPVYEGYDVVGMVGRAVDNNPVKYCNYPPKFKKSNYLYGLWKKPKTAMSLIVVEGPLDVITVNSLVDETYFCVGLMGAEPSKMQMDLLVESADEVICMLDNDSSGKKGQKDLLKGIGKRTVLTFVEYPKGIKDPDEAKGFVLDMLDNRSSALDWQVKNILRKESNKV